VASPGSHFQTSALGEDHVEVCLVALWPVLRWHGGLSRGAAPAPTPGKLGNVPELPPHFLPRPDQLRALADRLLAGAGQPVAITGAGRVGVQGMGGIGKSVLAAAVAREPEVRAAFPDGVLWVTVGQEPKLPLLQEELARQLDDRAGGFEGLEHGKRCLRALLAARACLVVLDDVWDAGHADAFAVLGPRCRLLLTTRGAAVLTTLGAAEHRLDVLDDEQARRLLADWSGQGAAGLPAEARAVARQCGNLPLALAVCGAMARDGIAWHDLRDALRDADLSFLDRQLPGYPHRDVLRCLRTSVAFLAQADPQAAGCYGQLAVFPKDEAVPEAAVLTLWQHGTGLKERQARKLLSLLERRALLRLAGEAPNRRVSLHDLQHDYLRAVHEDPAALHGRLLAAYRHQCRNGWPGGPNDGYFFEHLAYHLKEAGQADKLRDLLLDYGWIRSRLAATGVPGVLADYEQLPDDADLRLVQGALRLSAHVLARDPAQLGGQLLGRLLGQPSPAIQELLEEAGQRVAGPWLRPLAASLTPPGGPLLRTLTGHGDGVNTVAVTPDGRRAVSASSDRTLKVWDLDTGHERLSLAGHGGRVTAVAVTPDGRRAVSASSDRTLKVWDLDTGRERLSLTGHSSVVTAVAVMPDGRAAVSASWDGTLKAWDLASGHERRTLAGHGGPVNAVAVTPDGRSVVSASNDGTLKVWDLDSGRERFALTGHGGPVTAVAVTPDGRSAVSASDDRTLRVWDLASGREGREHRFLVGHVHWVTAVAVTPDGRSAVSTSNDRTLRVWDLASGRERLSFAGHGSVVTAVAVTPDGRCAVSASNDRTLKVWDLNSDRERLSLAGHGGWVRAVAVTAGSRSAVSASDDATLRLWDLDSGQRRLTLIGHRAGVRAVAVTPDGRCAVSASDDRTLKVWDLASGRERLSLVGHVHWVTAVAVTPDGRTAVSASYDGTLKVWDLHGGHPRLSLTGHRAGVNAVAVTPDGRSAVSVSNDGTLKVWDLDSGRERLSLAGHSNMVGAVAVTPEGRCAVSGSDDGTVQVWDLATGHERLSLSGHGDWVTAVAVTPDSRAALTASYDRTLKVWDLNRGALIATFVGDGGFLTCAVSPDGRTVAAGDVLGRVHFLRLEGA
jgi:WD40 repeat protein